MSKNSIATFAGGCFWGVEHYFKKQFGPAILKSEVGYTGGKNENPSYREVCSGTSGHAEAVQFHFDPNQTNFHDLCTFFFRIHDPTTLNRQGNDRGTQYRSAIFYHDLEQKQIAEQVMQEVKGKFSKPITTTLEEYTKWFKAESYHQDYLTENPGGYCNHRIYW